MSSRTDILNKLKNVANKLQFMQKEIMSMGVSGLELVREDLSVRQSKNVNKDYAPHGQAHKKYRNKNRIMMPNDGQGEFPHGTTPDVLISV